MEEEALFKKYLLSFLNREGIYIEDIDLSNINNGMKMMNYLKDEKFELPNSLNSFIFNLALLFDLYKNGICLFDVNYKHSEDYAEIRYDPVFAGKHGWMSIENYIEKFLLEEDELVFDSIYEMGNPNQLSEEDCQYVSLAKDIIINTDLGLPIKQNDLAAEALELVYKITRPGGLIDRINAYLSFDISLFDENNLKYKAEISKILYFIYMLENKIVPEMLGNKKSILMS